VPQAVSSWLPESNVIDASYRCQFRLRMRIELGKVMKNKLKISTNRRIYKNFDALWLRCHLPLISLNKYFYVFGVVY
jgi:hypothetical protein